MSIFSLTKETTGGATIIQDGNERFFGASFSPEISVKGNTLVLTISRYTYKISTTDNITINSVVFSGTISQLKAAVIPVFPKANPGTGGTGPAAATTATDFEFTDYTKGPILRTSDGTRVRLTAVKTPDNSITLNVSDPL